MSTDYQIVCHTCRKTRHLGQRMAIRYSFGFGSTDQQGANDAAEWMFTHMEENHEVTVEVSDCLAERRSDNYEYVHDERIPKEGL